MTLFLVAAVSLLLVISAPAFAGDVVKYETRDGRIGYATPDRIPAEARIINDSPGDEISHGSSTSSSQLEGLCDDFASLNWDQQKAFIRASLDKVRSDARRKCLREFSGLLAKKFEANCQLGIHSDKEAWLDALDAQAQDCSAMGR